MKPINSKERSKQVWQFLFIFFGLAVVPISLIFFSYYKVPEKITEIEQQKLIKFSSFDRSQKLLTQQIKEIDSNINLIANGTSNLVPEVLKEQISRGLSKLAEMDTSEMVTAIRNGYTAHLMHVLEMRKQKDENSGIMTSLKEAKQELEKCESKNELYMMSDRMSNKE